MGVPVSRQEAEEVMKHYAERGVCMLLFSGELKIVWGVERGAAKYHT